MHELKKIIRSKLLTQRQQLSPRASQEASAQIIQRILTLDLFQQASCIGLYHAFAGEVDLEPLWEIANQLGKTAVFPMISKDINNNAMDFYAMNFFETEYITEADATRNKTENSSAKGVNHFKIREPIPELTKKIALKNIDCLFIPLIAFDKQGYRLGMGKGYYDRFLENKLNQQGNDNNPNKPYCIGIAYDFQRVDALPHDVWDVPLDAVITENAIYGLV